MSNDPYAIDPKESQKFLDKTKGATKGLICPKKHYDKPCQVCDVVQDLFSTGDEGDRSIAGKIMRKLNFYVCAVSPAEPEQLLILQLGKLVGNQLIDGTNKLGWTDIANPTAGVGRCIKITKGTNGTYNTYQASIDPNKADFDIPKDVMDNLPDLENIVEVVDGGDHKVFNIASIKLNETVTFRICPDVKGPDRNNRFWINAIWRHWGVSQAEIDGLRPVNLRRGQSDGTSGDMGQDKPQTEEAPFDMSTEKSTEGKRKKCFGRKDYYDPNDPDCTSCEDFKACGRSVL